MIESKLETILLKHLKLLKDLLQTASQKKECIIKNRIADLDRILETENFAMSQINELEIERAGLLKDVEIDGKKLADLKVTEMLDCFKDSENKDRLKKIQSAITKTILDLKKINELNRELLSFAVNNLNEFFDNLFQTRNPPNVYTAKGKKNVEQIKRNIFLDKRA